MTSRRCMFFYFVLTVCLIYPSSLANGYNLYKADDELCPKTFLTMNRSRFSRSGRIYQDVYDRLPYRIPVPKRFEILRPYENELDNSVLEEVNYVPSTPEYSLAKSLKWLNTQAEITQKRFRSKLDELHNRRMKDDEEYPAGLMDGD